MYSRLTLATQKKKTGSNYLKAKAKSSKRLPVLPDILHPARPLVTSASFLTLTSRRGKTRRTEKQGGKRERGEVRAKEKL